MRLGVYDPYLDTLGGGEKYMASIALCLSKKHEVSLFWDDESILKKLHERFLIDVSSIRIKQNIFNKTISVFERLKKSSEYDAIFYLSDGSVPFLLCKKLYIHFQFPIEWVNPSIFTKIKISRSKSIICNSNFTKYYIDKKLGVKSIVLYPPSTQEVDDDKVKVNKEKIILSVGRFSLLPNKTTFKKQEVMISMFNDLIKKFNLKDWTLLLVISVKEEDMYNFNKIIGNSNNHSVKIIINASWNDLQNYYASSSIYWHAAGFGENIVKQPELAEHFGISTVQAMEKGTVPVVIANGGQNEIIKDGENGFLWKTSEECIKKTYEVIMNKALWNQVSLNAKKRAADFSVRLFCEQINKLILR